MSDGQEVKAGTSATSAGSFFRTTASSFSQGSGFSLSWAAKTGKSYRVLRSPTADFAAFDVVVLGLPGVEPTMSFTDTAYPPGATQLFYRVGVEE